MKSWFTAVSSFAQPDEAATYDFLIELCTRHEVSDATFNQLRGFLSEQQIVDLVTVSGTYVSVAMLLSAADQGVPAGKTPPLAPLDPK
jgi:4-carboxymuconolactone decarboxylase